MNNDESFGSVLESWKDFQKHLQNMYPLICSMIRDGMVRVASGVYGWSARTKI